MNYEPLTLVLIEDTSDDEHLALRALRRTKIPLLVRIARDGERGLRALGLDSACPQRRIPDLVISDLKMPKMNGDELLRRARETQNLADVPFVIFSSSGELAGIERCLSLGATEYAVKPVDYDGFVDRLQDLVYRHLGQSVRSGGSISDVHCEPGDPRPPAG